MAKNSAHFWLATWFGSGLSPRAPGTMGTLATVPLHFFLVHLPYWWHFAFISALIVLGFWCAGRMAEEMQLKDPQIVVIDESAGILLALWIVGSSALIVVGITIVLFRLLDIYKPWPISAAERIQPTGAGIMADDLVAGFAAGMIVSLLVVIS